MGFIVIFTVDFETLASNESYTYVWQWASYNINEDKIESQGIDIESFFNWCKNIIGATLYFHNLKFDGRFIIYELLKNGVKHYNDKKEIKDSKEFCFTTLITSDGLYYGIELVYGFTVKNSKGKPYRNYDTVKIFDSLKLLNFTVAEIAESFKLDMKKGEIDYKKHRPKGYQPTAEEWEYIYNDVKIVGKALKYLFDEGFNKITISSNALTYFIKTNFGKRNKFRNKFPILPTEQDTLIRESYRGGWTYVNEKYQDKIIDEKGIVFDVNSMYPWAMAENPMPWGKPIEFTGEYVEDITHPLYIIKFVVDFKLKEGKFPMIQLKKSFKFNATEYIKESKGYVELTLTSIDFELFKECYDYDIEYFVGGLKFKADENIFKNYISHFMKIKENEKGAKRTIAKLFLNGLYGKFATRIEKQSKHPYLNNELLKFKNNPITLDEPIYTAVSAFVTAYARDNIIRTAISCYERFMYADTDSIHILGEDTPNIEIHQTKLGAWKEEYKIIKSRFIRAKTYLELTDNNEKVIRVAGLPAKARENIDFENFERGAIFDNKLVAINVIGGVVLKETTFEIK